MPVHEAWVLGALIILVSLFVGAVIGHLYWPRQDLLDEEYWTGRDEEARLFDREVMPDGEEISETRQLESVPRPGQDAEPIDGGSITGPGRTIYQDLTVLGFEDELADVLRDLPTVDPDWHPAFLARSEAWLADTRAELGLVAA